MWILYHGMPEVSKTLLKGSEGLCRIHWSARPPVVAKSEGAVNIFLAGCSLRLKGVPELQGGA